MIMDPGDGSESVAEADAAAAATATATAGLLAGSKASKDFAVFPPSNLDNLHLLPPPAPSLSTQSSSSSSNFSYSSPSSSSSASSSASSSYSYTEYEECDDPCSPKPPIQVSVPGRDGPGLLRIGIGLIRSKVLRGKQGQQKGKGALVCRGTHGCRGVGMVFVRENQVSATMDAAGAGNSRTG